MFAIVQQSRLSRWRFPIGKTEWDSTPPVLVIIERFAFAEVKRSPPRPGSTLP